MIFNRQSEVSIRVAPLERFLALVLRKMRVPADAVTVCFVANAQMARWNKEFRGKRGPTDVLSFPADEPNGGARKKGAATRGPAYTRLAAAAKRGAGKARGAASARANAGDGFAPTLDGSTSATSYLGDIAIAPAVARANARRFGRTLANELRILILHGVIHLMGYDHETDHGEMDRLEQSLRRSLGL